MEAIAVAVRGRPTPALKSSNNRSPAGPFPASRLLFDMCYLFLYLIPFLVYTTYSVNGFGQYVEEHMSDKRIFVFRASYCNALL